MWRPSLLLVSVLAFDTGPRDPVVLLGQWTFDRDDARDSSGHRADGVAKNVAFKDGCAIFDGKGFIEIPLRANDVARKLRTIEVEMRVKLDRPEAYYNTLLSHPYVQVGVHSLGTGNGRPCFACPTLRSDLSPDPDAPEQRQRWGNGAPLGAATKERFYYWGWTGNGETIIPRGEWITIRTVYDGLRVTQYVNGKPAGTHPIVEKGARISVAADGPRSAFIGKAMADGASQHLFSGRIDYLKVRGIP